MPNVRYLTERMVREGKPGPTSPKPNGNAQARPQEAVPDLRAWAQGLTDAQLRAALRVLVEVQAERTASVELLEVARRI